MAIETPEMDLVTQDVTKFIIDRYTNELRVRGVDLKQVPDTLDLLTEGIIDSLGLMELVAALGQKVRFEIDFDGLDAEELTIVGPLSRYVANAVRERQLISQRTALADEK